MTYGTHQEEIEKAERERIENAAWEIRESVDDYWRNSSIKFRAVEAQAAKAPSGLKILEECLLLAEFLIKKNMAYGNSALAPIGIFSNTTAKEQIAIRIDDKLNRLSKGGEYPGDDTILDLIGYLVLYRLAD